jgi:plastocyanin
MRRRQASDTRRGAGSRINRVVILVRERPQAADVAGHAPTHVFDRIRAAAAGCVILLLLAACAHDATGAPVAEPRAGYGNMGLGVPSPSIGLLGPESFPCRPETGGVGYTRYGVGPMRRGGWEREELEPDHAVIRGKGVNLHGTARVADGETIELEMDEDYFAPSVLEGRPGATVTIQLRNEGTRAHNFNVPGQGIDLRCGVRSHDEVTVTFPRSGVLLFSCRYTASSGMRGALVAER